MNTFMNWLQTSFTPKMQKINNNIWITTIKDSIMQVLPYILVGSIFTLLTIPGDLFSLEWWPNFWTPFGWTMGMISIFVSFLIPFNLMEKRRLRQQRLIAGLTGIVVFLIVISPQVIADGEPGFNHDALGAGGMFVAIIAGVFVGYIMGLFGSFSFFNEDSVMPDFVRNWFDAMLPIAIAVTITWVLIDIVGLDLYNVILAIFAPLGNITEHPIGFVLSSFIFVFLYSMGISSWVLTPIFTPIQYQAIVANLDGAENIFTSELIYSGYMWIGGIGATLSLVLMMMFSKSSKLKVLGRASLVPSIFNINEPVVFGAIAWNPTMMIPMWLQGIILPTIVYFFTKVISFAPIPKMVFGMWYVPFPISTWIVSNGSFSAILLLLFTFVVSALIWYPFFKVNERQELLNEQEAE